jgi:hypothetical protein
MTHEHPGDGRCMHPGCKCPVASGKQFCSPHCAQAQASGPSGGCGCNHPDCH